MSTNTKVCNDVYIQYGCVLSLNFWLSYTAHGFLSSISQNQSCKVFTRLVLGSGAPANSRDGACEHTPY